MLIALLLEYIDAYSWRYFMINNFKLYQSLTNYVKTDCYLIKKRANLID